MSADRVVLYEEGRAIGTTLQAEGHPLWRGEPAAAGRPAWGNGTLLPVGRPAAPGVKSGRRDEKSDGR